MIAHQLDPVTGVILNNIMVASLDVFPNLVDAGHYRGDIGDRIVNGVLVPAETPQPTPPATVTRRQAIQALRINGVTEAMVETAINSLPISQLQKDLALIEFRASLEFEYVRPLVIQMCAAMNLNRDSLFIQAGGL